MSNRNKQCNNEMEVKSPHLLFDVFIFCGIINGNKVWAISSTGSLSCISCDCSCYMFVTSVTISFITSWASWWKKRMMYRVLVFNLGNNRMWCTICPVLPCTYKVSHTCIAFCWHWHHREDQPSLQHHAWSHRVQYFPHQADQETNLSRRLKNTFVILLFRLLRHWKNFPCFTKLSTTHLHGLPSNQTNVPSTSVSCKPIQPQGALKERATTITVWQTNKNNVIFFLSETCPNFPFT